MPALFVVAVLFIVVAATIFAGVKTVPQGQEWVVERLGKFHKALKPGLNFIVPYIDNVSYRVSTKGDVLSIGSQEVITKDNAVIITNAVAFIKVTDPTRAVYEIQNYEYAIQNLVMTSLRAIIGQMDLNNALSEREHIKARLQENIAKEVANWGIYVQSVEIQDIKPSESMQRAMEQQASADRFKQATILEAEGKREAMIREADGKLEAAKREAEAQVRLAQASARAISDISESVKDRDLPTLFLLGDRYISAIQKMATSQNSKMVMLPADLPAAIRGMMGKS
ncbi:SPFH domain-containing protein [Trichlorobacter lovleyi]|uniref:Band 7 protein n=1 Tax=Trichlorobacter lovleyi (strain ATCC BAA-1151 / DSM 17278 / SZ) TaxID=398767 RepID=B3E9U1_TRIL1|nr:SPFH domain-containing protein [Trichlorobacter lovleyi]ACD96816.1 band 7 protein [Trichlorobacter lovleyi SZ]QOX80091.1 SPFH/Band 7/PHB domain protein [Trichlorobacter lovleyi]